MTISDQLLAAFVLYGLPVLFGVILVSSIGIPLPSSFLLIAAGSYVDQGELNLWILILMAIVGAILGDQIGYAIGRWGGRRLVRRVGNWFGGENRLHAAEASTRKWGGFGIFLSRWLITPLGPVINLTSGVATYSYPHFLFWDVAGEIVWVIAYVMVGKLFSDRIEALTEMLGSLIWVVIGLIAAIIFGWLLYKNFHTSPTQTSVVPDITPTNSVEPESFESLLSE